MISYEFLFVLLLPVTFLAGRVVSKLSEEEIPEFRKISNLITSILITGLVFLTANKFLNIIITLIITLVIGLLIFKFKKHIVEKMVITLATAIGIVNNIPIIILVGLTTIFLKGLNTHKEKQRIFTSELLTKLIILISALSVKLLIISLVF